MGPMLQRANEEYEAARQHDAAAHKMPSKADIAKQPLRAKPSTTATPSSAIGPTTMMDQFTRAPNFRTTWSSQPSSQDSGPERTGVKARANAPATRTEAEPLQSRSRNVPAPLQQSHPSHKALQSIFHGEDSFEEPPDGLCTQNHRQPSFAESRASSSAMYITAEDFSDDDNLDLDFQKPSALPPLPLSCHTTEAKMDVQRNRPLPHTSDLSWSQSSPSHYQPPPHQQTTQVTKTEKRKSAHDEENVVTMAAKKRELPQAWRKPVAAAIDPDQNYATPGFKSKSNKAAVWDMTTSTYKAKQQQLRQKNSATTFAGGSKELNVEAMRKMIQEQVSHPTPSKTSAVTLSKEQIHVEDLVVNFGKSVFFTGPAGTGKSVLMRSIIEKLKQKYVRDPERVAVTASTGLAACNIGGMTLHSFSGIGLGKDDAPTLIKKIRKNPKAKTRWQKTKVLVIDEISMVDGDLFDKLSQIGRTLRNNGRPWGGIQLVITGDFFQLPPVPDGGRQRDAKFAFDAATWTTSIDHTIGLTQVFRQKDPQFANMLNEMRLGRLSDATIQTFRQLARPLTSSDDGLEVTELFPTRNEVESSNTRRLKALGGEAHRFDAVDTGEPVIRDKLLANMMAPATLELKVGAQVMLIKNLDETLVNGSVGTVVDFMTADKFEIGGGELSKSMSATSPADAEDAHFAKRMRAFTNQLDAAAAARNETTLLPIVMFHAADGQSRLIQVTFEDWKVELPSGEVQASRKQLPLILAWALSIHKAQGQTLERVKVDLGRVFEKGQAYVALSRATTQQGLQVLRFSKEKVMAHPKVVDFYNKLYSAESAMGKKQTASSVTITSFACGVAAKPLDKGAPMRARDRAKAPPKQARGRGGGGDLGLDEDEEFMRAEFG